MASITVQERLDQKKSSWTAPPGVTAVQVEAWGPGGNGGTRSTSGRGGGGGGGAYAKLNTFATTPGNSYSYSIPDGGSGANTTWNTSSCVAAPGANVGTNSTSGGAGGAAGSSTGDVTADGGAGGGAGGTFGGGGGESGGRSGTGNAGNSSGTPGSGNTYAGNGGGGASGNSNGGTAPGVQQPTDPAALGDVDRLQYGGGGGGAARTSGTRTGGTGAPGGILLTYTLVTDSPRVINYSYGQLANGTPPTMDKPTDTQVGDLLLFFVNQTNSASVTSPPTGFTQLDVVSASSWSCTLMYRIVDGSEGSTFTFSTSGGSAYGECYMICIRGNALTSFINAYQTSSGGVSGNNLTMSGVTPSVPNCLILAYAATSAAGSWIAASQWAVTNNTPRPILIGATGQWVETGSWMSVQYPPASATGDITAVTYPTTSGNTVYFVLAIAPLQVASTIPDARLFFI